MSSRIVHLLIAEAQTEHNAFKWDLALMLHALQVQQANRQQPPAEAQPAPTLATTCQHVESDRA